jgi:cell division septation protein DedD
MENRVRDLEFIQEANPEERGHRVGTILLAALTVVGLTFAMGVLVGRAVKPIEEKPADPLERLDRAAGLQARDEEPGGPLTEIRAEELTFPSRLSDGEEPPEVAAALAAAAAEEADLQALGLPPIAEPPSTASATPTRKTSVPATLPAAVGAGKASQELARKAAGDPLVTAAINEKAPSKKAPPGREGDFTLQVISYDRPEPARAFARGLRARGHSAFVVPAQVPGRGRYYRVRIGPFESRWKADNYRRRFEEEERMNTFVVRRPKA